MSTFGNSSTGSNTIMPAMGGAQWSTIPAISDVDINNFDITQVDDLHLNNLHTSGTVAAQTITSAGNAFITGVMRTYTKAVIDNGTNKIIQLQPDTIQLNQLNVTDQANNNANLQVNKIIATGAGSTMPNIILTGSGISSTIPNVGATFTGAVSANSLFSLADISNTISGNGDIYASLISCNQITGKTAGKVQLGNNTNNYFQDDGTNPPVLNLSTGSINMNNNNITNVNTLQVNQLGLSTISSVNPSVFFGDPANLNCFVDVGSGVRFLSLQTAVLNMHNNLVIGIPTPTNNDHATNKLYVDNIASNIPYTTIVKNGAGGIPSTTIPNSASYAIIWTSPPFVGGKNYTINVKFAASDYGGSTYANVIESYIQTSIDNGATWSNSTIEPYGNTSPAVFWGPSFDGWASVPANPNNFKIRIQARQTLVPSYVINGADVILTFYPN